MQEDRFRREGSVRTHARMYALTHDPTHACMIGHNYKRMNSQTHECTHACTHARTDLFNKLATQQSTKMLKSVAG
jgi:hypothetical protein